MSVSSEIFVPVPGKVVLPSTHHHNAKNIHMKLVWSCSETLSEPQRHIIQCRWHSGKGKWERAEEGGCRCGGMGQNVSTCKSTHGETHLVVVAGRQAAEGPPEGIYGSREGYRQVRGQAQQGEACGGSGSMGAGWQAGRHGVKAAAAGKHRIHAFKNTQYPAHQTVCPCPRWMTEISCPSSIKGQSQKEKEGCACVLQKACHCPWWEGGSSRTSPSIPVEKGGTHMHVACFSRDKRETGREEEEKKEEGRYGREGGRNLEEGRDRQCYAVK